MNEQRVSSPASSARVRWIDILKALGLLLVMMYHIHDTWIFNAFLRTFFISVFFFAGGLLYRERDILYDLKRRARTLVVPYFVFGAVIFLYWIVIERRFRPEVTTPAEALKGLVLGEFRYLGFHSHLWFLPCYFVCCVLYNCLRKLTGRRVTTAVAAALTLLFVLSPVFKYRIPDLPWGLDRVCQYILFFDLGTMQPIRRTLSGLSRRSPLFCFPIGLGVFVLGYFLHRLVGSGSIWWFVCGAVGTLACVLLAMALDRFDLAARSLARLGFMSIVFLCLHGPCYRVLIKLLAMLLRRGTDAVRASFLLSLLVLLATLLVCTVFYMLIDRYLPWVIKAQPVRAEKAADDRSGKHAKHS
ncbi:MAG: acyltransferase family protein [Oscillospiraceae bacterium]|nr:acyltransferase family protein [Oscillospiraceae bacterium]